MFTAHADRTLDVRSAWAEISERSHNLGERASLFHFRSSAGLEVDLVVEWNGALYGIEAKATATPTPTHADALARWTELAGGDAHGVVACSVPHRTALRPGIAAVPWHLTA